MSYKTQKDNSVKLRKQYTNKIRILTKRESIKKNQTEILELKNRMNEIKNNITLTSEWNQVKEKNLQVKRQKLCNYPVRGHQRKKKVNSTNDKSIQMKHERALNRTFCSNDLHTQREQSLGFPSKDDAVHPWNSIFLFFNIKNMLMKSKKKKHTHTHTHKSFTSN